MEQWISPDVAKRAFESCRPPVLRVCRSLLHHWCAASQRESVQLIQERDVVLPFVEREATISGLLGTQCFSEDFGSSFPDRRYPRSPFPAMLTTPGAGKSRVLCEFCASPQVQAAAAARGVHVVPLLITFNCACAVQVDENTPEAIESAIATRILLDAQSDVAVRRSSGIPLEARAAVEIWLRTRVTPFATSDIVVVLGMDEITHLKVCAVLLGACIRP